MAGIEGKGGEVTEVGQLLREVWVEWEERSRSRTLSKDGNELWGCTCAQACGWGTHSTPETPKRRNLKTKVEWGRKQGYKRDLYAGRD